MQSYHSDNTPMIHRGASKIAGKGRPVFPCKPDKSPCTPRGFKDATTDPARVTALFKRHPDALIGMPTGKRSGVFVVDVDRLEALGELERELPETLTVRTRRGGFHYYFGYVEGINNSPGSLPEGVDVRGSGGYVIVPPSEGYSVLNRAPIAKAPEWLLEKIHRKPKVTEKKTAGVTYGFSSPLDLDRVDPIPDGGRNNTLARIGGALRARGLECEEIEATLLKVNAERCTPPLEEEEVLKVAASVSRYPAGKAPPDTETLNVLDDVERAMWAADEDFKGNGGKSNWNYLVALLKTARQHGRMVAAGVEVSIDVRSWTLAAGAGSLATTYKVIDRLKDGGWIRRGHRGSKGKSGSFLILKPLSDRAKVKHSHHSSTLEEKTYSCVTPSRTPFSAPRLRRSSPIRKPKRGTIRGTSKPRTSSLAESRPPQRRIGPGCNPVVDYLEMVGGRATVEEIADALGMRRARDLTRRKTAHPRSRDGLITRLENIGVVEVQGNDVALTEEWLDSLNDEREHGGELEAYRLDMEAYNRQRDAYHNRNKAKTDRAPTQDEMQEARESYPDRRRSTIEAAIARLFEDKPECRGLRAGQITCRLVFYLPADFPRGPDGIPKDSEVAQILDGVAA